jgi:AcrR family transcriptional regulator
MPRLSAQERLDALAQSATRAFGRLGYRNTRMAEVARAAGMSSGLVFNYVATKEALFHLVFLSGFHRLDAGVIDLPLGTPAPGETVALIERELASVPAPLLRSAVREQRPDDAAAELRGIVEERYDLIAGLWPLLAVIERCARELPDVEEYYFGKARASYYHQLTRYLDQRSQAGLLRQTADPAITARIITESITWFAWHRHEGRDASQYDDDQTRQSVIDFICTALSR